MAKTKSKKTVSLFDNVTEPTVTEPTATATATATEPTATEPTATEPTATEPTATAENVVEMWLSLKHMLAETDEQRVAEQQDKACQSTKALLAFVKENFAKCVETLSASMAKGSDMTQDMAVDTILSLVSDKAGYDKLEAQLYICAFADLLAKINDKMRSGYQCYMAIAKACYDTCVSYLPANVRTLFNACIVFQKKGDDKLMHWVFWTTRCKTRNAVATHSLAQGCFIRSNGLEYLFTPSMERVSIETREAPNTRGEMVDKPVIDYQWHAKSQRILAFWKTIGVKDDIWEKTLAQYDADANKHVVQYKATLVEHNAKASVSTSVKGLETTKKAPNAVKVRNAKLKQLFEDMDF